VLLEAPPVESELPSILAEPPVAPEVPDDELPLSLGMGAVVPELLGLEDEPLEVP